MKSLKSVFIFTLLALFMLQFSSLAAAADKVKYIPLREELLEPAGAAVVWDQQSQSAWFQLRSGTVGKVTVGSGMYQLGTSTGYFPATVKLVDHIIHIPKDKQFMKAINLENAVANVLDSAHQRPAKLITVTADMETEAVEQEGDAADDPAIWVHPADPGQSLIIGANKKADPGGIEVYDLEGARLGSYGVGKMNNVDVRYNFPFGNGTIDIAASTNRTSNSINIFAIDPGTGSLADITGDHLTANMEKVYGFSLYHSKRSGKFYGFITGKEGEIEQWELYDNGNGKINGRLVREIKLGSVCEGIVSDDEYGTFYVGEENVAIWKFDAEPDGGLLPQARIDVVDGIRLHADIEGLAIYYGTDGEGYLIASSQGSDRYVIYDRQSGQYVTTFMIVDGAVDGTSETDGLDVISFGLGDHYPNGIFIAQDDSNTDAEGNQQYQNFKIVSWDAIANGADAPLLIAPQDPRQLIER
ncbi:phytase [Paenibacillus sp. J2TS4]|uniref:phytase n=1 Tax=Paenibacillus sp. J2TS4 TaxID=2807194 RepID=UPI001B2A5871|nr:phytase [Paenibacillus sp. J2TS4]GIP31001.1 3-phytase [Paenibacillus sp. J2TS4]